MNAIVKRIDELRKFKGMSKTAMADKSGVPRSTVNNWYYADGIPSMTNLENICVALEVTTEQFFSGLGSENGKSLEEKFLDQWRMLNEPEKLAVEKVITAFKATKAVQND